MAESDLREWLVERCLMQSLMTLSSSEPARVAAAAWLAAFDAARAAGATAEAAAAIAFLCSAQASYITGASLDIGGGVHRYV